jgi:hypothetical protein
MNAYAMAEGRGVVYVEGFTVRPPVWPRNESQGADRSEFAVLSWTRECGRCPICARESRARSRTTRSTLIWEIPGKTMLGSG